MSGEKELALAVLHMLDMRQLPPPDIQSSLREDALKRIKAAGEAQRQWPPEKVDLTDEYWQWVPFKVAVVDGPYEKTWLRNIQEEVGVKIGGRWFISMTRLYAYAANRSVW